MKIEESVQCKMRDSDKYIQGERERERKERKKERDSMLKNEKQENKIHSIPKGKE